MYKIYFIDKTSFTGGEPNDSKWNLIPNKPIVKLEYFIIGHKITLQGYDAYNHLVERVAFLQGNKKEKISKIILMAKKRLDVLELIFDYTKRKVYSKVTIFGKEYNNKPTNGWKVGLFTGKPKSKIE